MRILWHSNSPWSPSGYGNQTETFLWRLKALGHEIACSCFFGLQGGTMSQRDVLFLPAGKAMYGVDTLAADAVWWKADIVITLMDTWVLPQTVTETFRWVPWYPIDHDPVPPAVKYSTEKAYAHIAYSKFGVKMLKDQGVEALYVPHGVDTKIYTPNAPKVLKADKPRFLVGIVAANLGSPARKCFDEQIRAFGVFRKRHPDAMLYLHTHMNPPDGENLWGMCSDADIPVEALKVVDQYQYARGFIGRGNMASVYGSMNVLMNVSRGEGFGVPIVEAQACGTPVIVGNYSSMPELVGAGWKVDAVTKYRDQDSYQWLPSVDGIVAALEKAYQARGDMMLRKQARDFIVKEYDADKVVAKYWKPTLEMLAERIKREDKKPKPAKMSSNGHKQQEVVTA